MSMKNKGLIVGAMIVLAIGVIGIAVTPALFDEPVASGPFSSSGQRIYYTGADANGPIPRTLAGGGFMGFGMMGDAACVDCHGEDGRGGSVGMMYGAFDIPDIRYATLTTSRSEEGTTVPAWTDADIVRSIRDGIEPNGERIKAPMPRWSMTDADMSDVIAYLKELNAR